MKSMSLLKETFETLKKQTSRWFRDNDVLMAQSLLLVATESTHRCDELVAYWEQGKKNIGLFSGLRGSLFNTIGVLGMVYGVEPETIVRRVELHRKRMREAGLTGFFTDGSVYTNGTACYLALLMEDSAELMPKAKNIMDGWKKDHPWVTGNNDLFYAILHALLEEDSETQVRLTERCFQALKRGGHSGWADEVQAAAQAAALWPGVDLISLEERYAKLSLLISARFSFFAPNLRPVASLLAASAYPMESIVSELMARYEELGKLGLSNRETRLLLAANLLLLEHFDEDDTELHARLISIVIGVIYIQEVATVAAVAAAGAAG